MNHAELVELVNLVADRYGFTSDERDEALARAQADAYALRCFRALADELQQAEDAE